MRNLENSKRALSAGIGKQPCARTRVKGGAWFPLLNRYGVSLIEILLGITLFVLLFSHIMMAFAPTATDYQGMVRGYTIATNACNWYINHIEGIINFEGEIPSSELGISMDVTQFLFEKFGPNLSELKKPKAMANISLIGPGLYQIDLTLSWTDKGKAVHSYSVRRLKAAPSY